MRPAPTTAEPGVRPALLAAALSAVLSVTLLAGCAGDPVEDYCDQVESRQQALTEVTAQGGPTALLEALPTFEALRDAAPEDLRDDWDVVVDRLGALRDALRAADVDPATYDRDDPPAGLDDDQRTAIESAARQLATPQMLGALGAVQQQARDVCGTSLTL